MVVRLFKCVVKMSSEVFFIYISKELALSKSQGPHSHILMTGGGGGGPSDFLGSEILA